MSWENIFQKLPLAHVARDYPLTYVDIGVRNGFQRDLSPLAFSTHVVGFEPEPNEFERIKGLSDGAWASRRVLPHAISPDGGSARLHVTRDQDAASLLKPIDGVGEKYGKTQFFDIEHTITVPTLTLPDALEESGLSSMDYLKIDIEGAEFKVFQSAEELLGETLVIKTEACYLPVRDGQGLVWEIDAFLGEKGFVLMDIDRPAHWRREGYDLHPFISDQSPPYARGQLVHGDFLYFRDAGSLDDRIEPLIKLGLLAMSFGYFDHAMMAFERPPVRGYLADTYNLSVEDVVIPASRMYGRRAFFHAFRETLMRSAGFVRRLPKGLFS